MSEPEKFVPLTCDNCPASWKALMAIFNLDPCEECKKMGWGNKKNEGDSARERT
jgi:hypothetical protein